MFNTSAGQPVRGTGGTEKWWEIYDAAEAHFIEHGNLDAFFKINTRYRAWRQQCREARNNGNLTEDQIYFLKQIEFDFSPKKARNGKTNIKLERTLDLVKEFQLFGSGMSEEKAIELLNNLKKYRATYNSGHLSEKRGAELGVDHGGGAHTIIAQLQSRLSK